MIQVQYRQAGQDKLAIRPRTGFLYVPTEPVLDAILAAEWAWHQLAQPEFLLNKKRNMTNHELAREALEKADEYLDGDGLQYLRVSA